MGNLPREWGKTMTLYTLIIKGALIAALAAAESRGFIVAIAYAGKHADSIIVARHLDLGAPHEWMGAPPSAAPYPEGSLLWFKIESTYVTS